MARRLDSDGMKFLDSGRQHGRMTSIGAGRGRVVAAQLRYSALLALMVTVLTPAAAACDLLNGEERQAIRHHFGWHLYWLADDPLEIPPVKLRVARSARGAPLASVPVRNLIFHVRRRHGRLKTDAGVCALARDERRCFESALELDRLIGEIAGCELKEGPLEWRPSIDSAAKQRIVEGIRTLALKFASAHGTVEKIVSSDFNIADPAVFAIASVRKKTGVVRILFNFAIDAAEAPHAKYSHIDFEPDWPEGIVEKILRQPLELLDESPQCGEVTLGAPLC